MKSIVLLLVVLCVTPALGIRRNSEPSSSSGLGPAQAPTAPPARPVCTPAVKSNEKVSTNDVQNRFAKKMDEVASSELKPTARTEFEKLGDLQKVTRRYVDATNTYLIVNCAPNESYVITVKNTHPFCPPDTGVRSLADAIKAPVFRGSKPPAQASSAASAAVGDSASAAKLKADLVKEFGPAMNSALTGQGSRFPLTIPCQGRSSYQIGAPSTATCADNYPTAVLPKESPLMVTTMTSPLNIGRFRSNGEQLSSFSADDTTAAPDLAAFYNTQAKNNGITSIFKQKDSYSVVTFCPESGKYFIIN